jgi:cytochrome P450
MIQPQPISWERGIAADTPAPPLADPTLVEREEQPLVALYRRYGPIFRLPQSENELARIILAGPEVNVFVARHEDDFFTTREQWESFDAHMSQEVSSAVKARDGAANRQRRAASSRKWSRARILDQIPQMIGITQAATAEWQPDASIDVHASMRRLVAEQLGCLLLGESPGDYLDDFLTFLNTTLVNTIPTGKETGERFDSAAYQRVRERVHEFGRLAYEAHLRHPQPNGKADMLDEAITQAAEHPEALDATRLSMVVLGPMLAGLDTVANSLCFALYALLSNPEVCQRVQAEVDAAFRTGPLTWEKLKGMPDLHGAMMETLRRYPVASGHHVLVAQPLTVAGSHLSPGDRVNIAMSVPHFLEELYPDPMQFDIDRFREPRNEHRKPGAYAPFGLGDHTCLGAGIAEVQLMVTIATLLHSFALELDPPTYRLVIAHHPTPVPGNNFHIKVVGAVR